MELVQVAEIQVIPRPLSPLSQAGLLATGYLALAWTGHLLSWQTQPFTALWLPAGLYLAFLLRSPFSRWPLLAAVAFLGNLAFDLSDGKPLWLGLLFGLGNAAEGLLGAWLIRLRLGRCPAFDQVHDFLSLTVLGGVVGPALGACWGAWVVSSLLGGEGFLATWAVWASGDALGILLVTPLVLYLDREGWDRVLAWPAPRKVEALVLLLACSLLAAAIFGGWAGGLLNHKYLVLPLVLLGAFRLGHAGAFLAVAAVAMSATLFNTQAGIDLWVREMGHAEARVASLQLYLAVLSFTATAVAVILAQQGSAQAALAQREKQHRLLLESTHAIPFAFDFAADRFTYLGPQMEALSGYPMESWEGFDSWAERIHPEDREQAVAYCQKESFLGRDHEFTYRMVAADGRVVWILDTVSVVMGSDGPAGLVGFMRDITAQKQAEEDLRASEEKHRFLVESVGVVVWRGLPDSFAFTYVSPEAVNLLGYPIEHWTRDPDFWLDHLHPEDREDSVRHCREAASRLLPHEFEYRMMAGDGRVVWVRDIVNFKISQGRISEVVGVLLDITPRKQAEEDLRASRQRLAAIALNAPAYIVQLDPQGRIQYSNRAAEGLTMEDLLGTDFSAWVSPEHRKVVEEAIAGVRESGLPREYRVPGHGPQGELAHYHVRLSPEKSGDQVTSIIAMVTDISDRVRSEQERRALESQLRQAQKMEAIGTLASGIAHDFNNILAAIFGFAELAMDAAVHGQDNRQDLQQILVAAGRARDLVQQILTYSRKVEPKRRPINFNQEIGRGLKVLSSTLPKMIEIKTRLAPDLWRLDADPGQMNQVLMNLATNAAQAMPQGGELVITTENIDVVERACFTCGALFSGRFVRLGVEDNGHGIDPRIAGRIFDPFFTTKEVGKGTGLGLSMVQGIVKSHGGHIECESRPGGGTRFRVYLPGLKPTDLPSSREQPQPQSSPGGSETILLVDDEEALRRATARTLGDRGYEVLLARNGEEALLRYRTQGSRIDLVILDLSMPGMGGGKCLEELLDLDPGVKVVIASGYAPGDPEGQSLSHRAMDFLAKPFSAAQLLKTVRQVLDRDRSAAPPPA